MSARETTVVDLRKQPNTALTLRDQLAPLKDSLSAIVVLPHYGTNATPPRGLVESGHYRPEDRLPNGLVLRVAGSTPITDANMHLLANDQLGTGVSQYAIKTGTRAEIVERFAKAALPRISANTPTHQIAIVQQRADPNALSIVVRAGDTASALSLMEAGAHATVGQLARSPEYADLMKRSSQYRDTLAQQTASALGITIEPKAVIDAPTHSIARVIGSQTHADGAYDVYHDAFNTDAAHSGVIVAGGASGVDGFTTYTASAPRTRTDGPGTTGAWMNKSLNAMPTRAPAFDKRAHAETDGLPAVPGNPLLAYEAHPDVRHPVVAERPVKMSEKTLAEALQHLTAGASLVTTPHDFVAGVVHDTHTAPAHMTIAELAALAGVTTSKAISLPVDHPVVTHVVQNWNEIKTRMPAGTTLSDVLVNEYPVDVDPVLAHHSLHPETNAAAAHALTVETGRGGGGHGGGRGGGRAGGRGRGGRRPRGRGLRGQVWEFRNGLWGWYWPLGTAVGLETGLIAGALAGEAIAGNAAHSMTE